MVIQKMGFHSDQTDILKKNTGVVIISLGDNRILRFRNTMDKSITKDLKLNPGSLLYMENSIQNIWQHAIPKSNSNLGRISLTFRAIK